MMVKVQAILFATFTISLFSAFLAMLGKQWLNRYESTDLRGSAIERSHNRQRKLEGIVGWYFDHVMGSLLLMLQIAFLLLGGALSLYLWGIDITIASVVVGVTFIGFILYLFVVVAGTTSESCPYQTPAAHVFRHILHRLRSRLRPVLRSAPVIISVAVSSSFFRLYQASKCYPRLLDWWIAMKRPWYSMSNITNALLLPLLLFGALARDVHCFGRAIIRSLIAFGRSSYRQLMCSRRTTRRWFTSISSLRTLGRGQQAITMDLRCISWILQTSLDKAIHLSALRHLISMLELAHFHPTLVVDCFNIFTGCVNVSNGKVVVMQGLEQLAIVSADGFFRTLHHLAAMDPASSSLVELQRHYNKVFPSEVDFTDLPFRSTMMKIHALAGRFGNPRDIRWPDYRMTIQEHVPFAQRMLQAAQEGYQQTQHRKVPRWILRSALYFLSLGSVSPPSVVADCLTIVAIELDCDVQSAIISDERCVQI